MCVVVLQNCMHCVEGETCSCSATCDADGTEEDIIKVEEAIDTSGELPEAISFPPIKTEPEVKLWGFCELVVAHASQSSFCHKRNFDMTLNNILLCVICIPFELCNAFLKRRDFLEAIALNGRIILICILKK